MLACVISVSLYAAAYIICEADIIAESHITRSARNGYHCKKLPYLSIKELFAWSYWSESNRQPAHYE